MACNDQRSWNALGTSYLNKSGKLRTLGSTPHVPYANYTHAPFTMPFPSAALDLLFLFTRGSLLLVCKRLSNVETQTVGIQIHLVLTRLQDLGDVLGVLKLPQINIRPGLLDGITNQLGGSCLTLGADDSRLLLLTSLVDDECGSLCFLLRDLLGFDSCGELGREGEVLDIVSHAIF